jgi:isoleucyl-tRNA synthetase
VKPQYAVIWTTTPWTLPGNRAVAVGADIEYALVTTARCNLIVASDLVRGRARSATASRARRSRAPRAWTSRASSCATPFEDALVPVVLAEHVTLDAGTGLVHTAPAHGVEDFQVGVKYRLPLDQPVDDAGRFKSSVPHVAGLGVRESEKTILALLESTARSSRTSPSATATALLAPQDADHLPRHDPMVHRNGPRRDVGTPGTEGRTLREIARHAINNTRFYPEWGRARITAMIDNRPDWTLSRQRNWGTPLPFFLDRETDEPHPETERLLEESCELVERKAAVEAWFAASCDGLRRRIRAVPQDHRHGRRLVRLGHAPTHGAARLAGPEVPGRPVPRRAATSTAAGSSRACSPGCGHGRLALRTTRSSRTASLSTRGTQDVQVAAERDRPARSPIDLGAEILRLWIASTDYSARWRSPKRS